jgi:hypothetical protein
VSSLLFCTIKPSVSSFVREYQPHWFWACLADSSLFIMTSNTPSPYHVLVSYLVEEHDGVLCGGFFIKPMQFCGGVSGRSFEEFHAECYESLAAGIAMSDNIPFDTTDPRESVMFDFVECLNEDESGLTAQMEEAEDTFENIIAAIQQ